MPSRRPALGPGDVFGDFVVEGEIGRGAMGVVYAAVQTGLGRRVALKLIADDLADDEAFRRRFEREAVALASLDSRHVVTVHTAGTFDGHLYIATQLVEGGDAGAVLAAQGPFAPAEALGIAEQVAAGLSDAHRIGLVHRDVKPGNVLLRHTEQGWDAFLCDFGVVRPEASEQTATGVSVGTPLYMAPEVHLGGPATVASDVYAVGCLLWALVTGHPPYVGATAYSVIQGHLSGPVPQFGAVDSAAVDAVLRRAMAKDPGARHGSAAELREELATARRTLLAGPALPAPPPPAPPAPRVLPPFPAPPSPGRAPRRGRTALVALGALALVAVAGGVTWAVVRDGGDDTAARAADTDSSSPSESESAGATGPSSSPDGPASPGSPATTPAAPPTSTAPSSPAGTSATFGAGCGFLPATGPGSIGEADADSLATWLSATPLTVTTTTAITQVDGLADTLNSATGLTMVVAVDDAWSDLPPRTASRLLGSTGEASSPVGALLVGSVVASELDPAEVVGEQDTLAGTRLTFAGDTDGMTVSDGTTRATVVCGGIETANATVYLVDRVLTEAGGSG